jgi:hypothetical protein
MSETEDDGRGSRPDSKGATEPTSRELAREAAAELVGLEKRLPRTLLLLVTRPGLATLEYCGSGAWARSRHYGWAWYR